MDERFRAIVRSDPIYPIIVKVLEARDRKETLRFADALSLVEAERGIDYKWKGGADPIEIGEFNTDSRIADDIQYASIRALLGAKKLDMIQVQDALREAMIARMLGKSNVNTMMSHISGELRPQTNADKAKDFLIILIMGILFIGLLAFAVQMFPETRIGQLLLGG